MPSAARIASAAGREADERPGLPSPGLGWRAPVAVIVSRFPLITETFILREIAALERLGQPVLLVPLLRERPAVVHPEARPWIRRALYTPFASPAVLAANARRLRRAPRAYLGLLRDVARGNAAHPGQLIRTLALFPKCVYLAERLASEGVGHVHAHFVTHPGTAALLIHRLTGIPYSLTAHAHDIFVRRDMLAAKLEAARFVRCVSEFNRDFLRERYPSHAAALKVIHVGVDTQGGEAAATPEGPPRLLCVAALKPYKGHSVLLRALRLLRDGGADFVCDLVGEGPLRAQIETAVSAQGLSSHVRLLGARTQEEVARLIASAAAVVQPSVVAADGQMEGIPVALMEAMAARKAVVASALSGVPELVDDGVSGLLVPPGDAEALAAALRRVLAEPALAAWLGEQGRRKVAREFDLAATASEVLAAIDRHNAGPPRRWLGLLGGAASAFPALGLRRVHERPESVVAEVLIPSAEPDGAAREAILKVHRSGQGAPWPAAARREFEALSRLAGGPRAARAWLGTPQPLALDEDGAAVLMSRAAGEPLASRVRRLRWRGPAAHEQARREVGRAGAWLRALQEGTCTRAGSGALEALVREAAADADAARLPRGLAARVRARLRDLPPRVGPEALAEVARHGDLWPGNILVDDGHIVAVDLEGFGPGLPYEDAAYFLVQLGLFYSYPLLGGRRRSLEAAFLEAFQGGAAPDAAAWSLCRTAKALQVLARTRPSVARGRARARWRRRALLAMLEREA